MDDEDDDVEEEAAGAHAAAADAGAVDVAISVRRLDWNGPLTPAG